MKLKIGDQVLITAGKDKGRKGKISKISPKDGTVLVPGINMFKRHIKRKDEKNPGGIVDIARPLPTGKVALFCPKCSRATRIGYSILKDEKVRVCRKCDQEI